MDNDSLVAAEFVSPEWSEVISQGSLWKKLVERKVRIDPVWYYLSEKRGWLVTCLFFHKITVLYKSLKISYVFLFRIQHLFRPRQGEPYPNHLFYRDLYFNITQDLENNDHNWRNGLFNLKRINCRSENAKGVYCVQYDDQRIVSGQRDNSIKIWDSTNLECLKVLTGHTGSVLCLQYDADVIVSGSSDSTVRVWDANTGELVNTLVHHSASVINLKFGNGILITCSKVHSFFSSSLHKLLFFIHA